MADRPRGVLAGYDRGGYYCEMFGGAGRPADHAMAARARLSEMAIGDVQDAVVGAGHTHAWVQVYLPGAGWIEFDPTNGQVGGQNLIRVAVARDPSQAIPLQGTFNGGTDDFIDMTITVEVTATPG